MISKRYTVALSLEEAECVRGFIHMMQGKDLIGGADAAIGLRINGSILTKNFTTIRNIEKRKEKEKKNKG